MMESHGLQQAFDYRQLCLDLLPINTTVADTVDSHFQDADTEDVEVPVGTDTSCQLRMDAFFEDREHYWVSLAKIVPAVGQVVWVRLLGCDEGICCVHTRFGEYRTSIGGSLIGHPELWRPANKQDVEEFDAMCRAHNIAMEDITSLYA